MRLLIKKVSGKRLPPPFNGDGLTAVAVGFQPNPHDTKHRDAYVLENGKFVNCEQCVILSNLELGSEFSRL